MVDSKFTKIIHGVNHLYRSSVNFVKSSILSLIVIIIILLLLTKMDQTLTLLVDLVEDDPFSLLLSFFFINALAIVLSHYPIYTYYAANLNNSGNYTLWKKIYPFKNKWLNGIPLFVFTTRKDSNYVPDNLAHYFRYLLGILIYFVWIHYIISSFIPKLFFEGIDYLFIYEFILCAIPIILYRNLKEKFTKYDNDKKELLIKKNDYNQTILNALNQENELKLKKLYIQFGNWYTFIFITNFILAISTLIFGNFSIIGFLLLFLTSYAFMFNYLFFRLLRTKLEVITEALKNTNLMITKKFIKIISIFKSSKNYLLLFHFYFIIAVFLIFYSTLATIIDASLCNGIPILLSFFYFYYFIIANLKKYFFVVRKMKLFNTKKYRNLFIILSVLIVLLLISSFASGEDKTHQLDYIVKSKNIINEKDFKNNLIQKDNHVLFFISSHGGGLKANAWTLNVINTLQDITNCKLLENTVSFSGASGGSLGLALYTGLFKEEGRDLLKIQSKINAISKDNYVSPDLALTLGLDTYRKLWPLNKITFIKDRPYYSMIKYQNHIENEPIDDILLNDTSFRAYWKGAYNREDYFPSLIMNTSSTKGKRGILWSVQAEKFHDIFPFADDLADLKINNEDFTLPFYQAVSTTNRFPFLSPAAKIKGYGFYIDAGAIDNSGLLSNLDMYQYLLSKGILKGKKIVFIEILNSKDLYINHVLKDILKENKIEYLNIDENETDNIIADMQTGFNLDKIPGYLDSFFQNMSQREKTNLDFIQLYMPHKISMNDIEANLKGKLEKSQFDIIKNSLKKRNLEIDLLTEGNEKKKWYEPWNTYEPTLSRHLSRSSLNYINQILNHSELKENFSKIKALTLLQTNDNNK